MKTALVMIGMTLGLAAHAQTDFRFGTISAAGTGCPAGSTSVTHSPDQQSVSLIFDQLMASVPQNDNNNDNGEDNGMGNGRAPRNDARVSQKNCNISVEALIPVNHRLIGVEVTADIRGFAQATAGAMAGFHGQFLEFRGPRGTNTRRGGNNSVFGQNWQGPVEQDWTITKTVPVQIPPSACAAREDRSVKLLLRNVLHTRINPRADINTASALLTMDSADLHGKMKIKVNIIPCTANPGGGGGGCIPGRPGCNPPPRPRGIPGLSSTPVRHQPARASWSWSFHL